MSNQDQSENPTKGYITVATKKISFLRSAINLCEGILDYDENAKVTLFTDQNFVDTEDLSMFDKVIVSPEDPDRNAPAGPREKMWGMANTPYDYTLYLDSDIEIIHEDIISVFDRLEDDYDMCWVELKKETARHFAMWDWGNGDIDHLTHCGGVCLYRASNPLVREFMTDWYNIHMDMRNSVNLPKEVKDIPREFHMWDQLTAWWLIWHSEKYQKLKWKFFDDGYRWNYYSSFGFNSDGSANYGVVNPVILHHSSTLDKDGKKHSAGAWI